MEHARRHATVHMPPACRHRCLPRAYDEHPCLPAHPLGSLTPFFHDQGQRREHLGTGVPPSLDALAGGASGGYGQLACGACAQRCSDGVHRWIEGDQQGRAHEKTRQCAHGCRKWGAGGGKKTRAPGGSQCRVGPRRYRGASDDAAGQQCWLHGAATALCGPCLATVIARLAPWQALQRPPASSARLWARPSHGSVRAPRCQ